MTEQTSLNNKRVLIVDDEPDLLESLAELLSRCDITKADTFEKAKFLLENQPFDIAILDIMGVDGYQLLDIAREQGVMAVMLTAHAVSPDHVIRSYKMGAASYLPKEEMSNIEIFVEDILEAKEKGKSTWWRWSRRLADFWERKFGPNWQEENREFWKKFPTL